MEIAHLRKWSAVNCGHTRFWSKSWISLRQPNKLVVRKTKSAQALLPRVSFKSSSPSDHHKKLHNSWQLSILKTMILDNGPYLIAFILTAIIHMDWPSIPSTIHREFSLLASSRPSAGVLVIKVHIFAVLLLVVSLSIKTTSAASIVPSQVNNAYNVCVFPRHMFATQSHSILPNH